MKNELIDQSKIFNAEVFAVNTFNMELLYRKNTAADLMANRSQLPVEEKRNADCKIRFINLVSYYCVDGCISHGRGSNTNGISFHW